MRKRIVVLQDGLPVEPGVWASWPEKQWSRPGVKQIEIRERDIRPVLNNIYEWTSAEIIANTPTILQSLSEGETFHGYTRAQISQAYAYAMAHQPKPANPEPTTPPIQVSRLAKVLYGDRAEERAHKRKSK